MASPQVLVICSFALLQAGLAAPNVTRDAVGLLTVQSPNKIAGNYVALFAEFSTLPVQPESLTVFVPSDDPMGCSEYGSLAGSVVAVVRRGNCTFLQKAAIAEKAGAKGIIVVNDEDFAIQMGIGNASQDVDKAAGIDIFVVQVQLSVGDAILNETKNGAVALAVTVYEPSHYSEILIVFLGTSLVAAGAYFSTADLRTKSPIAPQQGEVMEVDNTMAIGFCFMGSCMLMVLFFLLNYLIYVIIFGFCIGGVSTLTECGSAMLKYKWPSTSNRMFTIPYLEESFSKADMIAFVPAVAVVLTWLMTKSGPYGWFFQDLIATAFLCWVQRTLRMPNMKIAAILLILMFFFDIFWVFVSPLIFKKSVMVEVATGGSTGEVVPMLLRVPAIGDSLGNERMLGFGDIVIPGLLVSYLRRFDLLSKRSFFAGYFFPALVGYFVGLCCTIVALVFMHLGQPALLYLVPGTLGTATVLSCCRGEFRELWEFMPIRSHSSPFAEESGPDDKSHGMPDGI